jgi:hypothetical protein
MENLYRVVYSSRINPKYLTDVDETLKDILTTAVRENAKHGITGLLIAHGGWFVQALEGSMDAVHATLAAIVRDVRHRDSQILADGPTEARMFGAWSMCARVLSKTDAAVLELLDQKTSFNPADFPERVVIRLLTTVAELHGRSLNEQHTKLLERA